MLTLQQIYDQIKTFKRNSRDWVGLRITMHPNTFQELHKSPGISYNANSPTLTGLFGVPIDLDFNMPEGDIRIENENQRQLREYREAGLQVIVYKPMDWSKIPNPPEPTLKALLKHWWNKLKRRNK